MLSSPTVRREQADDGICLLTLVRPDVHNALDLVTMESLVSEIERAGEDSAVRALVLTGEGASFCSGDDLRDVRSSTRTEFVRVLTALQRLTQSIFDCPLPVVGALNGPAYGAGLELVLACDARVAVSGFVCAAPEVRLGLVATNGASLLLPMIVGPARARRMLMSGGEFDAAWCLEAGLLEAVVDPDELLRTARATALELAGGHPNAVAATRWLLNAPIAEAMRAALAAEAASCSEARESEEARAAIQAFFDGRES
jgi:2-(1,2-epoxy-1,2-dihydrophenyl)acetyl-CoA isomerase